MSCGLVRFIWTRRRNGLCLELPALVGPVVGVPDFAINGARNALQILLGSDLWFRPAQSMLVTSGFPVEISLRFEYSMRTSLRLACEPLAHRPIGKRLRTIRRRMRRLARAGIVDVQDFFRIADGLSSSDESNTGIPWFCHLGIESDAYGNIGFRSYFGPVVAVVQESDQTEELMDKERKADQGAVLEKVKQLLCEYDMSEKASELENICGLLKGKTGAEAFVTFVGVDFEKDRPLAFKIYINPNI